MTGSEEYYGAILEDIQDQLSYLTESLHAFDRVPSDITAIKADMAEIKSWLGAMDQVAKDLSRMLANHDTRIITLETA